MSWFLREIDEVNGDVRLCMVDGRLIIGKSIGVDTSKVKQGILNFKSGDHIYQIKDFDIADYIVL